MREVVRFHIGGLKADGEPVPELTTRAEYVEAPRRHGSLRCYDKMEVRAA